MTIVIGGANYDSEMGLEYFQAFPFIDHVVVSKGEEMFPELVRHILAGKAGTVPNGVTYREGVAIAITPNRSLFSEFAETGSPDYDDYYHLLDELGKTAQGLDRILLYLRVERTDSKPLLRVSRFSRQSRASCAVTLGAVFPRCAHIDSLSAALRIWTPCAREAPPRMAQATWTASVISSMFDPFSKEACV